MLKVYTHESMGRGESAAFDTVMNDVLPLSKRADGFFASDMDDTMFHGDSGQLIFVECLRQPAFYTLVEPQALHGILLPEADIGTSYTAQQYIHQGASGLIPGVSETDCAEALMWRERLVRDFAQIQEHIGKGEDADADIRRFIKDVLTFDNLLISLNKQHPDQAVSARLATAFSRIRLFRGQSAHYLAHLAVTLLTKHADDPERHYMLDAQSQRIIDRSIRINHAVLEVLSSVTDQGMEGYVVTGSPKIVADSLIAHSPFASMIPEHNIRGVRLSESNENLLTGHIEGQHVFGITKRKLLEGIQSQNKQKVILALGDFPSSDRHMGAMSLENGGMFVVTHAPGNEEITRDLFDASLTEIMGKQSVEKASDRIVYIPASEQPLT